MNIASKLLVAAAVSGAALVAAPASAGYVVDTGEPAAGSGNWRLADVWLGGGFTLAGATTVGSVAGFIGGPSDNKVTIAIFANGVVPTSSSALYSATTVTDWSYGWQGAQNLNWTLGAGTYWIGFLSSGENWMSSGATSPLTAYGYSTGGAWVNQNFLGLGVRIGDAPAVTAGVPEPATWAMMVLGFGAVGGALRRRSRALAAA